MTETVRAGNLITLHYRVATGDDTELVSTFDSTPATLQLGSGELAPTLEHCLIGINVGERHVFLLESDQAFGSLQSAADAAHGARHRCRPRPAPSCTA
jgi:FKBP-type peptidyl-prolyl cis-trans isomerase SlpA